MRRTTGGLFKRGRFYSARWEHDGKVTVRSTGETTLDKAHSKLAEWTAPYKLRHEAEIFRTIAQRADSRQTAADAMLKSNLGFSDAWRAFITSEGRGRARDTTLRQYEIQWGRFVEWLKGAYPKAASIESITPGIAAAFIRHLTNTRTANTANKYRGLMMMIWDRLKKDKHITGENPWANIARRAQHDEGRRELTIDELRRVCQAAQGEMQTLIAIGIYTGLRLADAATLRWGEVDLVRGIIRRVPSKSRSGKLLTIPIHRTLRAILNQTAPESRGEYVMPTMAQDYRNRTTTITDRVQRLFEKCGIKTLRDRKGPGARKIVDAGYHSLRHAFVSMCAESSVPLSVVQGLIGHTTAGMTEKYFHLSTGAAVQAIKSLPAVTGKAVVDDKTADVDIHKQVRALAKKLSADTWQTVKKDLLKITARKGHAPAGIISDN